MLNGQITTMPAPELGGRDARSIAAGDGRHPHRPDAMTRPGVFRPSTSTFPRIGSLVLPADRWLPLVCGAKPVDDL